ncbi:MAG: hypothetical protein COC01_02940 [Bacteroidetes bacterium]|nr:MAG: hypothetical protein COC01_02940 [Bacteroidota bacterium]
MENESKMISARNVIATIKGSEKPDEKIIIGGHLDSWDLSDGAIDNGIGVYAIMDIARAFVVQKVIPKRTIEFAFWMGEEQGLNGSHAYVEKCLEDGSIDNIKYYINLDMSGNPSGFNLQGRPEMEQVILEIGKKIQEIDSTFKNEQKSKVSLHSDNVSFALEGIPVLHIIGNLDPIVYKYYHSNKDDFSLVNKEHMVYTSSVLGVFLNELSSLTEIPAKHYSSEETKNYYIEAGLKEKMMIGNEWKWEN